MRYFNAGLVVVAAAVTVYSLSVTYFGMGRLDSPPAEISQLPAPETSAEPAFPDPPPGGPFRQPPVKGSGGDTATSTSPGFVPARPQSNVITTGRGGAPAGQPESPSRTQTPRPRPGAGSRLQNPADRRPGSGVLPPGAQAPKRGPDSSSERPKRPPPKGSQP